MSDRTWDRIGAASGVAFIVLAFIGLGLMGGSSQQPAPNAPSDEILRFMSRPRPASAPLGTALAGLGFVFLLLFLMRVWGTLRQAERGTGWLSHAALAGGVFYLVFELTDAVKPRVGHGLESQARCGT